MSDFKAKCNEYFGSTDFYEILKIDKTASPSEVKKAYHKLSLLVHPDRVEEDVKAEATEKFKVLGRIYATLQDEEKRKVYDENGEFDDDADSNCNWMEYWRNIFKPITEEQIEAHKKEYINSEAEIRDIKKAYINGKGDMNFIHDAVPFVDCESEPRIMEIVRRLIDAGEVEEYDGFFNEPKRKKERRRRKYEEERKLCDEMRARDYDSDLEEKLRQRGQQHANTFFNLIANIEAQYAKPGKKSKVAKEIDGPSKPKRQKIENVKKGKKATANGASVQAKRVTRSSKK